MGAPTKLKGFRVLLEGPTGTGKTHSIGTLVETGIEVFYLAFESGTESLLGYFTDAKKEVPKNLHICTVRAAQAGWTEMADAARLVNVLSYQALTKSVDANRAKYDQFEKFLRAFNEVTDDLGNKYGCIDGWGSDKALVMDGMTGLGVAAMKACIGGQVDRDQKDWGLAQNLIENFLRKITDDLACHIVLLGHVERETDGLGQSKITISTLGKALAPKIPPMFSDVILATRLGREFFWDTENAACDLKSRNLPIAAKNPPSFGPILAKWRSRGGV